MIHHHQHQPQRQCHHRNIPTSPGVSMVSPMNAAPPPLPPRETPHQRSQQPHHHQHPPHPHQYHRHYLYHEPTARSSSLPSSARSFQGSMLDFHNLSQDSGISPSPQMTNAMNGTPGFQVSHSGMHSDHLRVPERHGECDRLFNQPNVKKDTQGSSSKHPWHFGGFFKRKGDKSNASNQGSDMSNLSGDDTQFQHFKQLQVKDPPPPPRPEGSAQAPPLPPRGCAGQPPPSNVFQPTMRVLQPAANSLNPHLDNNSYYYESSLGFVNAKPPHPLSRESTVSRGDRSSGVHSMARFSSLSSLDGSVNQLSSNGGGGARSRLSWKEKKETMKQRVEAKRNSVRDSSSEDDSSDDPHLSFSPSSRRASHRHSRDSTDLQMEVLERLAQMDVGPPPAPPPRDPRRRLYLLKNEFGRPVSYSFENINDDQNEFTGCNDYPEEVGVPVVPRSRTPIISANGPGLVPADAPGSASPSVLSSHALIPPFRQPQHLIPQNSSTLDQNIHIEAYNNNNSNIPSSSPSFFYQEPQLQQENSTAMPQQMYQQHILNSQQRSFDETPRSRRPVQMQRSLPPQHNQQNTQQQMYQPWPTYNKPYYRPPSAQRVTHHRYSSHPSLQVNDQGDNNNVSTKKVLPVSQNPPAEYWKSPPPILNSIPLHSYEKARLVFSDVSRDCSPQRPLRKKLSNSSAEGKTSRDSVISSQNAQTPSSCGSIEQKVSGKSSPSSCSISSKDSGCSDTSALSKRLSSSASGSRPLSAVMEKSEANALDNTSPSSTAVRVIVKEVSPPRTDDSAPGFSNKKRRGHYRDAMSELEDIFASISEDRDLLDRAERRDLPTAHQELIAQARERFQPGASEETSRNDGDSPEMFSDMDNFMNWNTSSSFENLPSYYSSPSSRRRARSRTPANRRSAVIDKVTDDMAYRVARANNRPPPEVLSPIAKVDHSYLLSAPGLSPAPSTLSVERTPDFLYEDEPDLHKDDVLYRSIRDANSNAVTDPQPKFGIPKDSLVSGCSNQDYLHAAPNPNRRKRSTFRASKKPDVVLDDMAFRSLRKDSNLSDPGTLGVVKDPNMSNLHMHSCWHHKMKDREYAREVDTGPYVFYPKKNHAILTSLSEQIAQIIKKQSKVNNSQVGESGSEDQIVTYEDLRDPKVYEAMKYTLNIIDKETKENKNSGGKEEEKEEDWKGKGIYELLSSNIVDLLERRRSKSVTCMEDESKEIIDHESEVEDVQVMPTEESAIKEELTPEIRGQDGICEEELPSKSPSIKEDNLSCILEHDLSEFNKTLRKHLQEMTSNKKNQEEQQSSEQLKELAGSLNIASTLKDISVEQNKDNAEEQLALDLVQTEEEENLCQEDIVVQTVTEHSKDIEPEKFKEKSMQPGEEDIPIDTLAQLEGPICTMTNEDGSMNASEQGEEYICTLEQEKEKPTSTLEQEKERTNGQFVGDDPPMDVLPTSATASTATNLLRKLSEISTLQGLECHPETKNPESET